MDTESGRPQTLDVPPHSGHALAEVMDAESSQPQTAAEALPLSEFLGFDGSESNESCQAFFTRKMQELGADTIEEETVTDNNAGQKESESDFITVTPVQDRREFSVGQLQQAPAVTFLDDVMAYSASSSSTTAKMSSKVCRINVTKSL